MVFLSGILLFLFLSLPAFASECRVNGGPWQWMTVSNTLDVKVNVKATPGSQRILLDGYKLECKYSRDVGRPSTVKDFWHTASNAVTPGPKLAGYRIGLNINGVDRNAPVGAGIHIATMQNDNVAVDLRTYMYVVNQGGPGNPIDIRVGDNIGALYLSQTNNTSIPPIPQLYVIRLNANNNFSVEPSTCTINNNQPIEVSYGEVNQALIGDDPSSSAVLKRIGLSYRCPTPGITMPIKITLKGLTSAFNANVLRLSNENLGTGLLRNGVLIGPERSFNTNIYNSTGADDVVFALVRKPGSLPATGGFTGSGTLVMGVP